MASLSKKRVMRELVQIKNDLPDGITFIQPDDSLKVFYFDMKVSNNPLYPATDIYRLRFVLDDNYPFESPQVQFITDGAKFNLLGEKWVPVLNLLSTTLSIHSLLVTNTRDERPPDDTGYVKRAGLNPKESHFVYHDDSV